MKYRNHFHVCISVTVLLLAHSVQNKVTMPCLEEHHLQKTTIEKTDVN